MMQLRSRNTQKGWTWVVTLEGEGRKQGSCIVYNMDFLQVYLRSCQTWAASEECRCGRGFLLSCALDTSGGLLPPLCWEPRALLSLVFL